MLRIEIVCDVLKMIFLFVIVVISVIFLFKIVFGDNSLVMFFLVIFCVIVVYGYIVFDKRIYMIVVYFKDFFIRIKSDK